MGKSQPIYTQEFKQKAVKLFGTTGKGHQTIVEEEKRRLKRENEVIKQERDILKKAISIFAQPHP